MTDLPYTNNHPATAEHYSTVLLSGINCALGTDLLIGKKLNGHTLISLNESINPSKAFVIGGLAVASAIATIRAVPSIYKYVCGRNSNREWSNLGLVPITLIPCLATQSLPTGLTLASIAMITMTINRKIRPYIYLYISSVIKEAYDAQLEDFHKSNV